MNAVLSPDAAECLLRQIRPAARCGLAEILDPHHQGLGFDATEAAPINRLFGSERGAVA
jgi:hypothetical protein